MVFLWYLLFGEAAAKYPKIIDYIRWTFALMGFFGSYIAQKVSNRGKRYINNVIDQKTDIADSVVMDAPGDPIPPSGPKG